MASFNIDISVKGAVAGIRNIDGVTRALENLDDTMSLVDFKKFTSDLTKLESVFKSISGNVKSFAGDTSKINNVFGAAKADVEKYKAQISQLKAENLSLRNSITGVNSEIEQQKLAFEQGKVSEQDYKAEAARLRAELAALRLEKSKNRQETIAANGSYREAQQRLTALGQSIRNAAGGFSNTTPAIRAQITEYRKLLEQLKAFDKQMGLNYRNVGNYGAGFVQSLPIIGQFTTAIGLATVAYQGLQKSFSVNLKLDALEYSLRVLSGNATKFGVTMDYLRSASDRLGLDLVSTAESFKQWEGAARFSNLTGEQTKMIFDSVANAGAKLKLSNDQVQGTFLALSQMLSKGVVSMEELRRQLGDRIPGAFQLAAKAMNLTEAELNKLVSSGKLASEDFLPKFAAQLDKSFGNNQNEKIKSLQASVNRLNTEFDLLFRSERMTKFFQTVSDGFTLMIKQLNAMINSKSWAEFRAVAFTGGQAGLDKNASLVREREMSKLDAVGKATYDFAKKEREERVKITETQKKQLDYVINQYRQNPSAKWKEELKFASSVYAEMIKINSELGTYDKKIGTLITDNGKKGGGLRTDYVGNIGSIAQRGLFSAAITATEGLQTITDRTREEYRKLIASIDEQERKGLLANKKNANERTKISAKAAEERINLNNAMNAKIDEQTRQYNQDLADRIVAIEEKAGVTRQRSLEQDLQKNNNYYAEKKRQAVVNASEVEALERARLQEEQNIRNEYARKDIERATKQYDKIERLINKPYSSTANSAKIQEELDKRLKLIEQYYENIRKILSASGLPTFYTKALEMGAKARATAAAPERSDLTNRLRNQIGRAVLSGVDQVASSITSIGQKNFDIEMRYQELREGKTAEQIVQLNKLLRLEKQIATGIGNTVNSLFSSINSAVSSVMKTTLTEQLGSVFSGEIDFKKFADDNKKSLYALGGQLVGSLVSGMTSPANTGAQALGGAVSGVATGFALGGPVGAVAGGLLGALSGIFSAGTAKKQLRLQEMQLAEQRKQTALAERAAALAYTSSIIGQQTNQGNVTGIRRNEFGNIEFEIKGQNLVAVLARAQDSR